MSEVAFSKQFLATLDKRPIKLPADHVSDPKKYLSQSPYILPRQTHPFPRNNRPSATQAAASKKVTATLKPMRSGETVTIPDITLNSTIHDLKTQYATKSGQSIDKIKLLLNKKPAGDLKTLKELGVDGDVELSVMLLGGVSGGTTPSTEKADPVAPPADKMDVDPPASAPESEKAAAEAATDKTATQSVEGILQTEEFWTDLKGFLAQRLRDQGEADRLARVFREASTKR